MERKGYQILERNYRGDRCEIDIIARKGNTLIFVEVKSSSTLIPPEVRVDRTKIDHLIRAATAFMAEKSPGEGEYRFDVLAMSPADDNWRIKHLKDAFRP